MNSSHKAVNWSTSQRASNLKERNLGRKLVAGVDSSTQSVKVVLRELESGNLVAESKVPHPDGTECDPLDWKLALDKALSQLSEFADSNSSNSSSSSNEIVALSIGGQQHGAVVLDESGTPIRKALLWNDTRSAKESIDLNKEFGGPQETANAVGSLLVPSFTATKLRWIADNEASNADKVARRICQKF